MILMDFDGEFTKTCCFGCSCWIGSFEKLRMLGTLYFAGIFPEMKSVFIVSYAHFLHLCLSFGWCWSCSWLAGVAFWLRNCVQVLGSVSLLRVSWSSKSWEALHQFFRSFSCQDQSAWSFSEVSSQPLRILSVSKLPANGSFSLKFTYFYHLIY